MTIYESESNRIESVYLESTIPSYLTARDSTDIIVLSKQISTKLWWKEESNKYEKFISPVVIDEISMGDSTAASKRLDIIKNISILNYNPEIENLTHLLFEKLNFSEKALRDVFHLSYSIYYNIDYLLTWNCTHIANAHFKRKLDEITLKYGLFNPVICTPDELIGFSSNEN